MVNNCTVMYIFVIKCVLLNKAITWEQYHEII